MCGIAGFLSRRQIPTKTVITAMTEAVRHRGPDDHGYWIDNKARIALGHTRLSILDLSPEGHQPMLSACGRYVIVFNGEIYNFREIRRELESCPDSASIKWRGGSDTEVMLAAFSSWGLEESLKRFIGMFAFAVWDRQDLTLFLVRDRIGEKPLYYGWSGDTFLFGSELKAIKAHPEFRAEINRDVIALLLRHNYIPAPHSIYVGIRKLLPGTFLKVPLTLQPGNDSIDPVVYWSARAVAENGIAAPFTGSEDEAIEDLNNLLLDAVKHQMVADVPLGAFLSGGVDSSTIVALMQAQSRNPVKTFTIGFKEAGYNEASYAKAVAAHLGTDHTELYVSPQEAQAVIPKLPALYDEPFSDSSQIPTFLVAQLTRKHVTVSLSGDAGDELFGGYYRYFLGKRLWNTAGRMPAPLRKSLSHGLKILSPDTWDKIFAKATGVLPQRFRIQSAGDKIHKLSDILTVNSFEQFYYDLVSHWKEPTSLAIGAREPATILTDPTRWPAIKDFIQKMMFFDLITYLPDDILVKVDRAAMAVSLETRVPFLDHRVAEFAWKLPMSMKIRNGQGKWILRQLLFKYVPIELIARPKMGFGIPLDSWLRGPLREWAEELLNERNMLQEGFLNPVPIRSKWSEHLYGKRNWQYYLWDVLMFQAWLQYNKGR